MTRRVTDLLAVVRPAARAKLLLSVAGSIVTALLDMLGVAALLPLMELLTGSSRTSGSLALVTRVAGQDVSDAQLAVVISVGIVAAFTVKALISMAIRWWQLGFLSREAVWAATALFRGYLTAPYSLHLTRTIPQLMRVMGDGVGQAYGGVIGGWMSIISEGATVALLCVLLLATNPVPAAVAIVYLALVALVTARLTGRRSFDAGQTLLDAQLVSFRSSLNALAGVKEISVRHAAEPFVRMFRDSQHELVRARRVIGFIGEAPKYVLELAFITGVALLASVTYAIEGPSRTLASLALFVAAGFRILPAIVRTMAAVTSVKAGRPGYDLVRDDLPVLARTEPVPPPESDTRLRGDLQLEDVCYTYPESDVEVVRGISLTVPRGSSVALVGGSGAGKSTLVNLILGLLQPSSGRITVGGTDIASDLTAWQLSVGLVPQLVYLFNASLADNVTFGIEATDVDEGRLRRAIENAELGSLAAERGGRDIGERGVSGGQQQRIGIARVLYYAPEVILLDEATSALDNLTEHKVTETIRSLQGTATMVVVAHRLSTVRHCDQIVLLKDGKVADIGTFESLRQSSAEFARLVELGSLDE